ncbi:hypothetical protein HZH66_009581 [Vespula vulgaris]|uniref:Uncharacterized protein n=1 Tax=Vespula vulgaris TaxID=7454 RepID=A0A834JM91_VESVU|nr:hypothetical protein HZH66_009581 [Vespula vulgaris]
MFRCAIAIAAASKVDRSERVEKFRGNGEDFERGSANCLELFSKYERKVKDIVPLADLTLARERKEMADSWLDVQHVSFVRAKNARLGIRASFTITLR